jgi:hypothetical protein
MALRVAGPDCRVAVSVSKEDGLQVSHVYCQNKVRGIKCRLEAIPGKKAHVLSNECFEPLPCPKD